MNPSKVSDPERVELTGIIRAKDLYGDRFGETEFDPVRVENMIT